MKTQSTEPEGASSFPASSSSSSNANSNPSGNTVVDTPDDKHTGRSVQSLPAETFDNLWATVLSEKITPQVDSEETRTFEAWLRDGVVTVPRFEMPSLEEKTALPLDIALGRSDTEAITTLLELHLRQLKLVLAELGGNSSLASDMGYDFLDICSWRGKTSSVLKLIKYICNQLVRTILVEVNFDPSTRTTGQGLIFQNNFGPYLQSVPAPDWTLAPLPPPWLYLGNMTIYS